MKKLKEKSSIAIEELEFEPYRKKLQKLKDKLQELREKLIEAEKSSLQDLGYKPINIDEFTIMVPVGMTLRQLRMSLKQMRTSSRQRQLVKYLVDEEDIKKIRDDERYENVVERREDVINKIKSLYEEFWEQEVKPRADSEEEKIIYMLSGLNEDIRSRKISKITGISIDKCKQYRLKEECVFKSQSPHE